MKAAIFKLKKFTQLFFKILPEILNKCKRIGRNESFVKT